MSGFNIAGAMRPTSVFGAYMQGKALALKEQHDARRMEIMAAQEGRAQESFEMQKEDRNTQREREEILWDQSQQEKFVNDPSVESTLIGVMEGKGNEDYIRKAYPEFADEDPMTPEEATEILEAIRSMRPKEKPVAVAENTALVRTGPDGIPVEVYRNEGDDGLPEFAQKDLYYQRILDDPSAPEELRQRARRHLVGDDSQQYKEKDEYYLGILNDENANPMLKEKAKRHFAGTGSEIKMVTDADGNTTFSMVEGKTNELTTGATSAVQKDLVAAQDALDEIDALISLNKDEVPPWAYGRVGDATQAISSTWTQLSLPFSKWVEGTLNPQEARKMRSQSLVFGGKIISIVTGEQGRFTENERKIAFKAAGVMTDPDSTPAQVKDALNTMRPLIVGYMERRHEALTEGLSDEELEMERLRREIQMMGGNPDE